MNNLTNTSRASSSLCAAGLLGMLLGPLAGCYIDAKIGEDPDSDGSTTGNPGNSSDQPGTISATGSSFTTGTSGAPTGDSGGVDAQTALELCGVVVVPPVPEGPFFQEGVRCSEGCAIDVESSQAVGLSDYGDCLCEVMACGDYSGGTTGSWPGDEPDTDSASDSTSGATGGEPDGCGPFPPGEGQFTCTCEMCSIDVVNVDATWIEREADLPTVCACMCGGAGCGSPT